MKQLMATFLLWGLCCWGDGVVIRPTVPVGGVVIRPTVPVGGVVTRPTVPVGDAVTRPTVPDGGTGGFERQLGNDSRALDIANRLSRGEGGAAERRLGDNFHRLVEDNATIFGNDATPGIAGRMGATASGFSQFREWSQAMSDLDRELDDRILRDDGAGPSIPVSCDGPACAQCYASAYGEMNFVRLTLERMRSIYKRTENMITWAESFGDSVSPIHGVSGLAWQYQKVGIERDRAHFKQTTRHKYEQLMASMQRALQMVDTCERDHYGNPDWYNRFGYMYYNFVKEAYDVAN